MQNTLLDNLPISYTCDELHDHFISYYNENDLIKKQEIRDDIFNHNLGLVHLVLRRLLIYSEKYDDYFSIGCFGLLKAIESFKVDMGIKFSTYACKCIINEIFKTFGKSSKKIKFCSIYDQIPGAEDLQYIDIIADPKDVVEDYMVSDEEQRQYTKICNVLSLISEPFQTIFKMYYGVGVDRRYTLEEIASKYGCSKQHVSKISIKIKEGLIQEINNIDLTNNVIIDLSEKYHLSFDRIEQVISSFTDLEIDIFRMRYGIGYSTMFTPDQIALFKYMSTERVTFIINKIDKKLSEKYQMCSVQDKIVVNDTEISFSVIMKFLDLFAEADQQYFRMYYGVGYSKRYSILEIFLETGETTQNIISRKIKKMLKIVWEILTGDQHSLQGDYIISEQVVREKIGLLSQAEQKVLKMYYGVDFSKCYSIVGIASNIGMDVRLVYDLLLSLKDKIYDLVFEDIINNQRPKILDCLSSISMKNMKIFRNYYGIGCRKYSVYELIQLYHLSVDEIEKLVKVMKERILVYFYPYDQMQVNYKKKVLKE